MGAVTKQPKRLGSIAAGIVLVLWVVLFFSGKGMLVWFTQPSDKVGMLKCQYFTGTGVVERQFLYTKQGFLGRDTCPRFIGLDP
jgi:uncharacterized protein YodC (DUF2158 family)